jgi:hypothetical protein
VDEDIVIPIAGMLFIIVLAIGVPLVRAYIRRQDRRALAPQPDPEATLRLERIETAIDAMSVEVERIAEGQRFVTRLLAERQPERAAIPSGPRHDS